MAALDLQQLRFTEGQRIFAEGDVADALYLVAGGSIGLYRLIDGHKTLVRTLVGGGLFGVTSIIDGGARSVSAIALAPSLVVRIPAAQIHQKTDRTDPLLRQVLTSLAAQLRDSHRILQPRPRSVFDYITLLQEQADNLAKFLINTHEVADSVILVAQIEQLQAVIDGLRKTSETIRDRRENSLVDPPEAIDTGE